MQYKTIALELIRERPELYERLRSSKRLLPAMDAYAIELKQNCEAWQESLRQANPHTDPSQRAGEALEMAVQELRDSLPDESLSDAQEPISLDAAMTYLRRHTPPA